MTRKVERAEKNQDSAIAWELRKELRISTRHRELVKRKTKNCIIRVLMAFKKAIPKSD